MVLRQALADHYSPIAGEVAAGDVVDLPEDLDGTPLHWPEEYWGDPPAAPKTKATTKTAPPEEG